MDDEKFVHGFIVRSSTDAPKRFWFFSQMMSVAIPKWGLMSYLDELISLRVCRSRDWWTWNQKFWTWLVLWLLSREISETCRFWFASGIVCTWNQVSPSVFSLKECESNSLREISAQLRLTGLLFCVVSSRNYTVWSRGSWLGGALVSAQCCVASFTHRFRSRVWRCLCLGLLFHFLVFPPYCTRNKVGRRERKSMY